jgi:hypothetical protein
MKSQGQLRKVGADRRPQKDVGQEIFGWTAKDPKKWVEAGERLIEAMLVLGGAIDHMHPRTLASTDTHNKYWGVTGAHLMIAGMASENFLKAFLVAHASPDEVQKMVNGKLLDWGKALGKEKSDRGLLPWGHDLVALAKEVSRRSIAPGRLWMEAPNDEPLPRVTQIIRIAEIRPAKARQKLTFSRSEVAILGRLAAFSTWAGRYSTPVKADASFYGDRRQHWPQTRRLKQEHTRAQELVARLARIARIAAHYWWRERSGSIQARSVSRVRKFK